MKDFFKETGEWSMTRLVLFIDICICLCISILAIILDRDLGGTAMLIGALLLPVTAAKAVQSFSENRWVDK